MVKGKVAPPSFETLLEALTISSSKNKKPIAADRLLFWLYHRCTSVWPRKVIGHLLKGEPL